MRIITGPTGSGKTDLAAELSDVVFNADAYQFYREIPILSNQPAALQKNLRFVADRSIKNPINAGDFSRETLPLLDAPGLWTGTGLYLGAAIYGLDEKGRKGTPFQGEPRRAFKMVVIHPDRKQLYERLDARVDQMCEQGAIDEAKAIAEMLQRGEIAGNNSVLRAIGLSHLLKNFSGELKFEEALRLWKRDTRRLAKRQLTWLRGFHPPAENILWLDSKELDRQKIEKFFGN